MDWVLVKQLLVYNEILAINIYCNKCSKYTANSEWSSMDKWQENMFAFII